MKGPSKNLTEVHLANAWISRYEIVSRDGDQSQAAKELFWAFQALDALCSSDALRAWRVILAVVEASPSDAVLDNLVAGPLESVLARNGHLVIDAIEHEARENQRFRSLLQGLWRNVIPPEIWHRIERARSST